MTWPPTWPSMTGRPNSPGSLRDDPSGDKAVGGEGGRAGLPASHRGSEIAAGGPSRGDRWPHSAAGPSLLLPGEGLGDGQTLTPLLSPPLPLPLWPSPDLSSASSAVRCTSSSSILRPVLASMVLALVGSRIAGWPAPGGKLGFQTSSGAGSSVFICSSGDFQRSVG